MAYDDDSVVDDNYVQDDDTTQGVNLHQLPPPPPLQPIPPADDEGSSIGGVYRGKSPYMQPEYAPQPTDDKSIFQLAGEAAGKLANKARSGIIDLANQAGQTVAGDYKSVRDALEAYVNGDNAAPPHVVDAAMQAIADQNPSLDKSQVVQAAIAGTADPLSPGYMDQAGRDVFGGVSRPATVGQAPAGPTPTGPTGYTPEKPPAGSGTSAQTGYSNDARAAPNRADRLGVTQLPAPYGLIKSVDTQGNITYPDTPTGRYQYAKDSGKFYDRAADYRRIPPGSEGSTEQQAAPRGRAPAARGRRSDLDTGTEAPVQTAMADSGTMSDASNNIRSTVPAGAQVAAASQTTGYANQPPAPGGFSGAAGPSADVAVRPGAFTPAGAAPTAAPAAPGDYPQGYKLVPVTGGQYDRALVGPDGQVVNYVRKGEAPPSPETVSAKIQDDASNDNRREFFRRLREGEPTGIDLNQYIQHGYNFSQPLPPRQQQTAQSIADRYEAFRQNILHDAPSGSPQTQQTQQAGGLPPPPQPTGNKTTDAYNLEVWKEQAIAARGAGSQQNAVTIAQQKATATAAAAALHTFDTGQQTLIRSIYTKANSQGEDSLTPNEKALRDEYVDRIRQHSRSQSGGQQGAAPGIRSTLQNAAGGQQPVRVNSMADAARLPRGTQFLDPNGNLRTVP